MLSASSLFFSIGFHLLIVIMSAYTMDSFKASSGEAGVALSLFVIGSLGSRLAFGRWIEKSGQKKMLCIGLFANLIITLLYFTAGNIFLLYGVRFLHGASFGIATSVSATMAANIIPKERRGEGLAIFGLSVTLSTAIGPFLGMFLYRNASYDVIFGVSAFAAFLALVMGLFTSVSEIKLSDRQTAELKGFKLRNFLEPSAIPICILVTVIFLCYSSLTTFLTPYARDIGLLESASFFFLVYAVVVFFSRPFIGRLFDMKGPNIIMFPAIALFAGGMLLVSQAHSGLLLLVSAGLLGLACGSIQSTVQTIAIQVSPQHRLGLANSTFFMSVDIGVAIGPFLFGMLLPLAGYRNLYAVTAGIAVVCILLYYLLHGKKASGRHTAPGPN
ncbi:MAG: MFS transporter [Dehalococcoidales bacterium]|nr:MFS transporter [Dehalococcoidales bacterium]